MTLLSGGCLCMPTERERTDDIAGAIRRTRANFLWTTPTVATLLTPSDVPTIRTLALIGEPMRKDIVDNWTPHVQLINSYGPAEASVMSSAKVVLDGDLEFLDIGRPWSCRYWVVSPNNHNQIVPIGCPGELLIQGPIVAQGYLGLPEATAAAFIDLPTWTTAFASLDMSQRFYKTGDVVVQLAEGSFIYMGRKDTQVKIRGFRVELGEIEYHLRQHSEPGWQFAVEVIQLPNQEPSLAAFFAIPGRSGTTKSPLRDRLLSPLPREASVLVHGIEESLPPYMVPKLFIPFSKLPSTSTGKTDRKALRSFASSLSRAELTAYHILDQRSNEYGTESSSSVPLADDVKLPKKLTADDVFMQQMWAEVLSVSSDSLRATDNFFALGGNSIRAMRLVAAIRRAGRQLSVIDVFQCSSFSELTARLSAPDGQPTGTVQLSNELHHTSFPRLAELAGQNAHFANENVESIAIATDVQAWMLAVGKVDEKSFHDNVLLEVSEGLDLTKLQKACAQVIRHQSILGTIFVQAGNALLQVVLRVPPVNQVSISGGEHESAGYVAELSILPRFHLSGLSEIGSYCPTIRLDIHHALYDAISLSLVLQDVRAAYEGETLSYGPAFHHWISHVGTEDVTEAERFWGQMLRGSSMAPLAQLSSSPVSASPADTSLHISIPLLNLRTSFGTFPTALKAAWSLVLAQACGKDDVAFGQISANRNSALPAMDQVAGPCINLLPVRARLDRGAKFATLVEQLQEQFNASIPYQHLGFRSITKKCTSWSSGTRFSSIVVFQNHAALDTSLRIGDKQTTFSGFGSVGDSSDMYIEARPSADQLDIKMEFSSRKIPSEQAHWLSRCLAGILETFSTRLQQTIGQLSEELRRSVGPYKIPAEPEKDSPKGIGFACTVPAEQAQGMVTQAWSCCQASRVRMQICSIAEPTL